MVAVHQSAAVYKLYLAGQIILRSFFFTDKYVNLSMPKNPANSNFPSDSPGNNGNNNDNQEKNKNKEKKDKNKRKNYLYPPAGGYVPAPLPTPNDTRTNRSVLKDEIEGGTGLRKTKRCVGTFKTDDSYALAPTLRHWCLPDNKASDLPRTYLTEFVVNDGTVDAFSRIPGTDTDAQTFAKRLADVTIAVPPIPTFYLKPEYLGTLFVTEPKRITARDIAECRSLACPTPDLEVLNVTNVSPKKPLKILVRAVATHLNPPPRLHKDYKASIVIPAGVCPVKSAVFNIIKFPEAETRSRIEVEIVTDGSCTPVEVFLNSARKAAALFAKISGVQNLNPPLYLFSKHLVAIRKGRKTSIPKKGKYFPPTASAKANKEGVDAYTLADIRENSTITNSRGSFYLGNLAPSKECWGYLGSRGIATLFSFFKHYLDDLNGDNPKESCLPQKYVDEILFLLYQRGRPIQGNKPGKLNSARFFLFLDYVEDIGHCYWSS